jgi:hypothetical protein
MKRWALLALLLAACGGDADNRREIEKDARHHEYAPVGAIDEAVRVEATTAAATIYQRIQLTAVREGNAGAFYSSLNGGVNAGKLAKLGISESELKGRYYVASDYTLSISGNKLVITASKPGTRGYKSEEFILR